MKKLIIKKSQNRYHINLDIEHNNLLGWSIGTPVYWHKVDKNLYTISREKGPDVISYYTKKDRPEYYIYRQNFSHSITVPAQVLEGRKIKNLIIKPLSFGYAVALKKGLI